MNIFNAIRAGILFVAGLAFLLFPTKILRMQAYITKRLHINYSDSKTTVIIVGVLLLIASVVLLMVSIGG